MKNITSLYRWIYIVLLGFASAIIVLVVSALINNSDFTNFLINAIASLNLPTYIGLNILSIAFILYILNVFFVFKITQLKNISCQIKYPPITISVLICVLILFFSSDYEFSPINLSFIQKYHLSTSLILIALLAGLLLWNHSKNGILNNKKSDLEDVTIPEWIEENSENSYLYRWLNTENPINHPKDDLSSRRVYADRIAEKLLKKGERNHICLIGPFGIGKTSIWKMTNEILNNKNFIFVPIDGWGIPEGSCAAIILNEIVYALSDYVDSAAIKAIPKEYTEAIAGTDLSGASFISSILLLHNKKSPIQILNKIDKILSCIGKRIVVVLEDFDRNENHLKTSNEIASLLDRLRQLNSIDFILCIGVGEGSEVLSRISTYREDIAHFNTKATVQKVIHLMNEYTKYKNIEPIEQGVEHLDYINDVIKTPREMKYILRRSLSAWEKLAGEVNYQDLLIVNILRHSSPETLSLIVENFEEFKKGKRENDDGPLIKLFNESVKNNSVNAISNLVKILFPKWNFDTYVKLRSSFQRLDDTQGSEYLNRILSESVSDDLKDVEFIKKIRTLNETNSGSVLVPDNILNEIIFSENLTYKFIKLTHITVDYGKSYVSGFNLARFILARYKNDKSIYVDEQFGYEQIKYLVKKIESKIHFFEITNFFLKKDIQLSIEFFLLSYGELSSEKYVGIFYRNFIDGDTDMKSKSIKFKESINHNDPNTIEKDNANTLLKIYAWVKNSRHDISDYIDLLVNTFKIEKIHMCPHMVNIIGKFVLSENMSIPEKNSWLAHKNLLIELFDEISANEIPSWKRDVLYPMMVQRKEALKSFQ